MIFLYYRIGNGQNYPKSSFLNAFINVEISFFLQIGSKYSLQPIKWGIFHSTGSDRAVVLTGIKWSNQITLIKYREEVWNGAECIDHRSLLPNSAEA